MMTEFPEVGIFPRLAVIVYEGPPPLAIPEIGPKGLPIKSRCYPPGHLLGPRVNGDPDVIPPMKSPEPYAEPAPVAEIPHKLKLGTSSLRGWYWHKPRPEVEWRLIFIFGDTYRAASVSWPNPRTSDLRGTLRRASTNSLHFIYAATRSTGVLLESDGEPTRLVPDIEIDPKGT